MDQETDREEHYFCTCGGLNTPPRLRKPEVAAADKTAEVVATDKDEEAPQGNQ